MSKRKVFLSRMLSVFMAAALTFTGVPSNIVNDVSGRKAADMSAVCAAGVTADGEGSAVCTAGVMADGEGFAASAMVSVEESIVCAFGDAAGSDYGLADSVEDGVILHAWNWSFKQIKEELPKIAAAGFTSIQTSPAQANKDGNNISGSSKWWKFYQPTDFTIGNKLGTKEELTDLCTEADKYGIKIIVDVVANHLANVTGKKGNAASDRSSQIPSWIRENDDFWHSDDYSGSSDSNRKQMTRGPIGMPDLNTGNKKLQDYIIKYLNDLQDCGVDGFRFDAAKHIETPDDDSSFASQFWERVARKTRAKDSNVFLYGEILNSAGPGNYNDIKKYTKYIKVTNNLYGNNVQSSVDKWDAGKAKDLTGRNSSGTDIFGSNGNDWVLWNESHDTFAGGKTNGYSNEQMLMAWCAVAARYSTALYFVRPSGGSDWKSSELGSHEMAYTSGRIAAMNKFHNYFAGKSEYASTSDNVLVVERSTSGVALINYNQGSKKVSIQMHKMKDGTYTDQVTGNTFTVSNGILTGTIGEKGVAAIYNPEPAPTTNPVPTISKEGGNFHTDTLELKLDLKDATSGTYKVGNGEAKTYTESTTITIGSDLSCDDSVTVTLTATDGKTTSEPKIYTFTKVEKIDNVAYLSLPSGWSEPVYCYAYDSETGKVKNAEWPGEEMSRDSVTGYYKYEVPDNIEKPRVIFYSSADNRTPGRNEPGYLFETDGTWLYKNETWSPYSIPVVTGTVTVKYVDEDGKTIREPDTLQGTAGSEYVTTAADIPGYTLKTIPENAAGTYTKDEITVVYVYAMDDPGCQHTTTEVRRAKEATCIGEGYTGDVCCTLCDAVLEQGTIIKALGHDLDTGNVKNAKEATCTETGYTGDTYCTRCETYLAGKVIPAKGHTFKEGSVSKDKEATCTEEGYTGDGICTVCGDTDAKGTVIPPLGHDFSGEVVNEQSASCESSGYTGDICCTRCEERKAGETIPATGHNFCGAVTKVKKVTCTEAGYTGDTCCIHCENTKPGKTIAPTGHQWNEGNITKEPTATEKGNMRYTCIVCNTTQDREIPATGGNDGGDTGGQSVTPKEPVVPAAGTLLRDGKAVYKVISSKNSVPIIEYVKTANSSAKTVTIPATVTMDGITYKVTAIAKNAFKNNKKITKIVIGSNIETIGAGAFWGCTKLNKVVMGNNVTTIGVKVFYKCTKLKSIIIPAKVKKIGKGAFGGCKNLKKITIKAKKLTKKNVGNNAFKGIHSKANIKVPKNKLKAYKKLLLNKGIGSKVKIKKSK